MNIAQTPLSVSSAVDPNVMLLIDDSGSMNNVIWASGFDSKTAYTDWGSATGFWSSAGGNTVLYNLELFTKWYTSFPSGSVAGYHNGTWKYLYLPDPVGGGSTYYTGNYLNYLFSTYPSGTDLRQGQIPSDYRMNVAKTVAKNLVAANPNLRFGVSTFYGPRSHNYAYGATVSAGCGSSASTITSAINGYTASTNTPLAEAYYELTRYFRGLPSYYHSGTNYTSPIQYRCQKNFVIVITDGLPTEDTVFPKNDPDDPLGLLPDWDQKHPVTTAAEYPNFPQYSDGFQSGNPGAEGYSLYLDDMAKFGYDTDMRKAPAVDLTGTSFDAPDYPLQNLITYTVGFAASNQMLEDAASYGHGLYFTATNSAQLTSALQAAIRDISSRLSSAAAVGTNSTKLGDTANPYVYQSVFRGGDWNGDLLAYAVQSDGTLATTPAWKAASLIPGAAANTQYTSRHIFTYDPAATPPAGISFAWGSLDSAQQSDLNKDYYSGAVDSLGADRLAYLAGDQSKELANGGSFRNRGGNLLGDIVDSAPLFVGDEDFGFTGLPTSSPGQSTYSAFVAGKKTRTPMLYVGANDGMLHAFNADTGVEQFAYVPSTLFPKLGALSSPQYVHADYVDSSAKAVDAYIDTTGTGAAWHTVLLGGLGGGGKGIFALDVSDPGSFAAGDVLWEVSDQTAGFADLGDTFSQPTVARLADGEWVAIFGNGYDSATNKAALFIVNLATGALVKEIDTGAATTGSANGLSTPVPVDVDGDHITDYVYAGDLRGNLWKFDLTSKNPQQWDVAYTSGGSKSPLFTAVGPNSEVQPITSRPVVGKVNGNIMVFFGTGRYFAQGDNQVPANPDVESIYGIIDANTGNANKDLVSRAKLQQQKVLLEQSQMMSGSQQMVRITSQNPVDPNTQQGWYEDLLPANGVAEGERVVASPLLRHGRIIFTTMIPNAEACSFGGTGWLVELDAATGGRLDYSAFDTNNDGKFGKQDLVTVTINGQTKTVAVSEVKSAKGIDQLPQVVSDGDKEYKYISSSDGTVNVVTEKGGGSLGQGRRSWLQLR